jgi:hypothetical protein
MTVSFPKVPTILPSEHPAEGTTVQFHLADGTMVGRSTPFPTPRLDDVDDHFRLLDLLFAEAEALVRGNNGKAMARVDRKRLNTLTREIDDLLDRAENLPLSTPANSLPRQALDLDEPPAERLDAFDEPTVDELLIAHGSRVIAARVHAVDALELTRLDGPLTLDVENALDRITAQIDLSLAMDLAAGELFTPGLPASLSAPQAARVDAVLTCMDRILAACPDHFLTKDAQGELEALMSEADRILGMADAEALPDPTHRRDGEAWRRAMDMVGRQVAALLPGAHVLPA